MKQTIEIEVPDGKKAVWKEGTIVFEDTKPKFPKTWEEFCEQNKVKIQVTEQYLALMQLHQLRDCYRQGWVPDYLGESGKWYIVKYYNRPVVSTNHNFSEFLSFQSKEIAQEFLNNFRDLIEQAGDLV